LRAQKMRLSSLVAALMGAAILIGVAQSQTPLAAPAASVQNSEVPPAPVAAGTQTRATPPPSAAPAGRGRGANFPQQTRELASPDVIARGKAVYGANCASCHAVDMRGGDIGGPNLIRSQLAMSDQHGELIAPVIHGSQADKGMPAINLSDEDVTAVAEYIHSVLYNIGRQGRPPNDPNGADLQVIVGSAAAGKIYFDAKCASCHSIAGDLAGIGMKYPDGRQLQNFWVPGGGAFAGRSTPPTTVTVTMTNGAKIEGTLVRKDDFIVTLMEADGTRKSISRNALVKSVVVQDPHDAHRNLAMHLDDKDMHDVTAYLATVK
jgi:cytochrome c oxidase cbb3-type subunit 3